MNQTTLKMPDGRRMDAIFISTELELTSNLLHFWQHTRCNPIVAFDTEWACNTNAVEPNSIKAKISLLKLCNVANDCLLINLATFTIIPEVLIKFLAVKDIRFVGINISKELQKLKEDYGLEIKNAIELTTIAADRRDDRIDKEMSKVYEDWSSFKLETPCTKYAIPLGGFRLLSVAFWGKQLSAHLPPALVSEENSEKVIHYKYLTLPVYAALQIGIELLIH